MQKEILEDLQTTEIPSLDITHIAKKKPRYTKKNPIPIEKLIALRKKGLAHHEIASIIGCARETVTRKLLEVDLEGLERFQEHEGSIWAYHRRRVLRSITDADLKKSTLLQKTIAAGTMMDKQMLKEGKSGVQDTLHITIEHRLIAERVVSEIGAYEIKKLSDPVDIGFPGGNVGNDVIDAVFMDVRGSE